MLLSFVQSDDVILDIYGYVVEALHHTPNEVERSEHVVPGNPASAQRLVENEHNCEVWELYFGAALIAM